MLGPARVRLLNEEREISARTAWNANDASKLWLYNLHYFDDLNAAGSIGRTHWHQELIGRWIRENPPTEGIGWESYPLSLRIVNWIKWALAGFSLPESAIHSLAVQARYLSGRLEFHLLGNHLLANAKALTFAGAFFDGPESAGWLDLGMRILAKQVPEQILPDGGHFERSTMYHALAYEDLLDLQNLRRALPRAFEAHAAITEYWPDLLQSMRTWLEAMCHPDGEISFFNDAAMGVAPVPGILHAYAERLGIRTAPRLSDGILHLEASGYVRAQRNGAVAFLDVAPIGPDYLPGHAHADTLSFELSLGRQRVVVNSGTSGYGADAQRAFERSTAAHNTLEIDGADSSEVWASFRVARRARPIDIKVRKHESEWCISAAHDGYQRLPGQPKHRRLWTIRERSIRIEDRIEGRWRRATARMRVHPDISVQSDGIGGTLNWRDQLCFWRGEGSSIRVEKACWYPEFGKSCATRCIEVDPLDARLAVELNWSRCTSSS